MSEETTTAPAAESTGTETPAATTEVDGQPTEQTTSYVNGKYNSVTALEEGYTNLAKKLGSFSGSPEEYSFEEGKEYNAEHPLFTDLQEYGKENNLSNEGYNKLVDVLVASEQAAQEEAKLQAEQVMKDLGADASTRVQNINDFVGTMEIGEEQAGLIQEAIKMPGGVELLEAFMAQGRKTAPASEQVVAPQQFTQEKLNEMRFATDSYGNRRMSSDPAYRQKVNEYAAKVVG